MSSDTDGEKRVPSLPRLLRRLFALDVGLEGRSTESEDGLPPDADMSVWSSRRVAVAGKKVWGHSAC